MPVGHAGSSCCSCSGLRATGARARPHPAKTLRGARRGTGAQLAALDRVAEDAAENNPDPGWARGTTFDLVVAHMGKGETQLLASPLHRFVTILHQPLVVVPIANYEDNQHAPDENPRLAILTTP